MVLTLVASIPRPEGLIDMITAFKCSQSTCGKINHLDSKMAVDIGDYLICICTFCNTRRQFFDICSIVNGVAMEE